MMLLGSSREAQGVALLGTVRTPGVTKTHRQGQGLSSGKNKLVKKEYSNMHQDDHIFTAT
jgi:hypothetical protein